MAASDLSQLSNEEIQQRLEQRVADLQKMKEQKAAPAAAPAADSAAAPASKPWFSMPMPQKAPAWGIFVMPLMFIYQARHEMSLEAICAAIMGTVIAG